MDDKLLKELLETMEAQSTAIESLIEAGKILKDRVEGLEKKVNG